MQPDKLFSHDWTSQLEVQNPKFRRYVSSALGIGGLMEDYGDRKCLRKFGLLFRNDTPSDSEEYQPFKNNPGTQNLL